MRHHKSFRKLGRTPSHRRALLRNLATALVVNERIETTLPKAKELRRVADRLITLGKNDTLHSRRQAMKFLMPINRKENGEKEKWTAVHRLFTEVAPRYSERAGGYTRVLRTRKREGDKAQMAIIEFVETEIAEKQPARRTRRVVKRDAAAKLEQPADKTEAAKEDATSEAENEAQKSESSE